MKLLWLGYLVYSLGNCAMKLCIETSLKPRMCVPGVIAEAVGGASIFFFKIDTVALSFVFDRYCPIID